MILADTDVLNFYLDGVEPVASHVEALVSAGRLQTTAIHCFELLSGAGRNRRGDAVRKLVSLLSAVQLDKAAAERAAVVRQELEEIGQGIGVGDSLIAGIALANDMSLLTGNQKHFQRVPDLKLI